MDILEEIYGYSKNTDGTFTNKRKSKILIGEYFKKTSDGSITIVKTNDDLLFFRVSMYIKLRLGKQVKDVNSKSKWTIIDDIDTLKKILERFDIKYKEFHVGINKQLTEKLSYRVIDDAKYRSIIRNIDKLEELIGCVDISDDEYTTVNTIKLSEIKCVSDELSRLTK